MNYDKKRSTHPTLQGGCFFLNVSERFASDDTTLLVPNGLIRDEHIIPFKTACRHDGRHYVYSAVLGLGQAFDVTIYGLCYGNTVYHGPRPFSMGTDSRQLPRWFDSDDGSTITTNESDAVWLEVDDLNAINNVIDAVHDSSFLCFNVFSPDKTFSFYSLNNFLTGKRIIWNKPSLSIL